MVKMNVEKQMQIAINYYIRQGYEKEEAIDLEKQSCYAVLDLNDYLFTDIITAFAVHLDNIGELEEIPKCLYKYINFDKWYIDFVKEGGKVSKIYKNVYIITW